MANTVNTACAESVTGGEPVLYPNYPVHPENRTSVSASVKCDIYAQVYRQPHLFLFAIGTLQLMKTRLM